MSLLLNDNPMVSGGGYKIPRSLRFVPNNSCSALSAVSGNDTSRTAKTYSVWFKFGGIMQTACEFFTAAASTTNFWKIGIDGGQLILYWFNSTVQMQKISTQMIRDPGAWYHLVVTYDTTRAVAEDRIQAYLNNVRVTSWGTNTQPAQNGTGFGSHQGNTTFYIGRLNPAIANQFWDGYLAEAYCIDGQALNPTDFGRTDAVTGQWMPKQYTGTYGTHGFYLPFSDNSSVANVWLDKGGTYTFTPTGTSVTTGYTNDSTTDTPTDYFDGNVYHGNFPVFDQAHYNSVAVTLDQGNTSATLGGTAGSNAHGITTTMRVSSGKWYVEWRVTTTAASGIYPFMGFTELNSMAGSNIDGTSGYSVRSNGTKNGPTGTGQAYGSAFSPGDVCMGALDLDNNKVWFGKNGTWFNSGDPVAGTNPAFTVAPTTSNGFCAALSGDGGAAATINLGQINFGTSYNFAYQPPSGFKAICGYNLPRPAFSQADSFAKSQMYTGSASPQSIITKFAPDFVYIKSVNAVTARWFDSVRGGGLVIPGDSATAETAVSGFSLTSSGFNLPANSSGLSDTGVSFHSLAMRKGPQFGFDIVTWTGNGATNRMIDHNLGGVPEAVISRGRSSPTGIVMWHKDMAGSTSYVEIDNPGTVGAETTSTFWGTGSFTATQFMVSTTLNTNGVTFVAYLYRSVPNSVWVGTVANNNSANGVFTYTGFKPAMLFAKATANSQNAVMFDGQLPGTNPQTPCSYWLMAGADSSNTAFLTDFLSNGFKIRNAYATTNRFIAVASTPMKYARGC